jgi:hypothetical protein
VSKRFRVARNPEASYALADETRTLFGGVDSE